MKRSLIALLILLAPVMAFAADTCTMGAIDELGTNTGKYEIPFSCVADATGNFSYTLTASQMDNFDGKYGYIISSRSNTVSEGAELEIRDAYGRVLFDAAGNGNDFLSQSAIATVEYFSGPNTDMYPIFSELYPITIYAENAGAGNFYLLFTLLDN